MGEGPFQTVVARGGGMGVRRGRRRTQRGSVSESLIVMKMRMMIQSFGRGGGEQRRTHGRSVMGRGGCGRRSQRRIRLLLLLLL